MLLIDEPSIGLEPRYIDMVFEILDDLQRREGKTIVMVEQNAKKGLAFADIGYVLVSGRVALAARGADLLDNPGRRPAVPGRMKTDTRRGDRQVARLSVARAAGDPAGRPPTDRDTPPRPSG